jgi:hypothetical protein
MNQLNAPLPLDLIKKIVAFRWAQTVEKEQAKAATKKRIPSS